MGKPYIAWIADEDAEGVLAREYDKAKKGGKSVSPIRRIMSQNGQVLRDSMMLYGSIMFADSPLSRIQRETIAVVVSKANGCEYCTQSHSIKLHQEFGDEANKATEVMIHALARNWHEAELGDAEKAMCAYAEKLTLTPQDMTEADIEALRTAGLTDRAISDLTQIVGYFCYINRIANGLGVPPAEGHGVWGTK